MSRLNKIAAHIYNPLNQNKKMLLENFVVRQHEFNTIFRDLKNSRLNETSQNFLIQGQRGAGKTTLLAKVRYEVEGSRELSHLLPVQFMEEQYNIFSLNRLWENVAEILEEIDGFEKIVEDMEMFDDDDEDDLYFVIERHLKKNRRKLLLLIDNFGDILDKLRDKEHKKLRDILHESDLQIIAGSTRTLETAYRHDKPFFESFKTIYLESLNKKDVQILLENLSRQNDQKKAFEIVKNQKSRIETIRRLTGGIPRTIILLYEIIVDDSASVFEDLEGILDKITPLYKHRMDDLPTKQQAIVDAMALNWEGMDASEISKKAKSETKSVSAQLKVLEKNGWVRSTLINKKDKMYMLEERFFNIWYLMRYGGKKKKEQVLWLVSFLRDWGDQEALIKKANHHIALAKTGKLNQRGGYYMAEALFQTLDNLELRCEVVESTRAHISKTDPCFADSLPDTGAMVCEAAGVAYGEQKFEKVEKYWLMGVENKDADAMFRLGALYVNEYKDFGKAEKYWLMAAESDHLYAMYALAFAHEIRSQYVEKAEKYWVMAIKEDFKNNGMNFCMYEASADDKIKNIFLNMAKKYHDKTNYISLLALSSAMIHGKKYKESARYFNLFLDATKDKTNLQNYSSDFVILLISRKQRHLAFNLFQEEKHQLKEKIKPVYYALMSLMRDEYPKEYKKMGSEISETVDEVLERIKKMGR